MKPVFQTRFGGKNATMEEQGNCFQACLASILELSLDETFDLTQLPDDDEVHWHDRFQKWLSRFGLATLYVVAKDDAHSEIPGFQIAHVWAAGGNERYVIVIKDGVPVHDPMPGQELKENLVEYGLFAYSIFVLIDASQHEKDKRLFSRALAEGREAGIW